MHRSDQRTQTPRAPSPPELSEAPELAVLGVLEVALDLSVSALFAEHPTLVELAAPGEPESLRRARQIHASARSLQRALTRYRVSVFAALSAAAERDDDDLPF